MIGFVTPTNATPLGSQLNENVIKTPQLLSSFRLVEDLNKFFYRGL